MMLFIKKSQVYNKGSNFQSSNQQSYFFKEENRQPISIPFKLTNRMNSYIMLLIFIPGLCLIFTFTKASLMQFLLGFGLCLLAEGIFLVCYCIVKMQQALLDSTRIKLQENYNLQVQKQYPFRERKEVGKMFLNKYTEEEKLQTKKNTLKVHSFQNYINEQQVLNEQPKREILRFLKQKHIQNSLYDYFNTVLIQFGNGLLQLQSPPTMALIPTKYAFEQLQSRSPCEISQAQLQHNQRQLLDQLEIKIRIKKDQQQNIILPSWSIVIAAFKALGKQFTKIQEMHHSNQSIIDMVKNKIIQDFEFIESQIKKSLKSLHQIQLTSLQLKKENDQFLSNERNVAQHQMDLMFLLKQHYYKYQDFQLRIKQNQKNYHLQTKRLSYFREKLTSFYKKNKEKYEKIFKTRLFAILDSYNITIEQSIKIISKSLNASHFYEDSKPPKVTKLQIFKNVDQQIQAQKKYQTQYFQRAQFYHHLSQELLKAVSDMTLFLQKVHKTFSSVQLMMTSVEKHLATSPQGSKGFTAMLMRKFSEMMRQLTKETDELVKLHSKFKESNSGHLITSQHRTQSAIDEAWSILSQLINPKQAIQHKYKLVKIQLQQLYQSIEEQIKEVKRFQLIFNQHSNRTKKILLMQMLYFLHLQRLYMSESDLIKQSTEGTWISHNQMLGKQVIKDSKQENNEQQKQDNLMTSEQLTSVENIYTGQFLHEDYVKVINRFLFSAYSEWKNSQFFKQTLIKQLYVLLNKEQNQSINEVTIMNLQLEGYPPEILWVRELHSQPFQFLADLSIAFKGKLLIYLKTEYKLMGLSVPTEVKVEVEQLYCCVRICFVPSEIGQSWFSFIGQPIAKFTVQPKIYTISINVQTIRNFFSTLLLKKLKQSTFPIREKIMIPVSKQDPMLELIQKRFKSNYHF